MTELKDKSLEDLKAMLADKGLRNDPEAALKTCRAVTEELHVRALRIIDSGGSLDDALAVDELASKADSDRTYWLGYVHGMSRAQTEARLEGLKCRN